MKKTTTLIEQAIYDITHGFTVKEAAAKNKIDIIELRKEQCKQRIDGGVIQRDKRSQSEIISASIKKDSTGCWLWVGRNPRLFSKFHSPRAAINYILHIKGRVRERDCGNDLCINPGHDITHRLKKRDLEIFKKHKKGISASSLATRYQMTRNRIYQILKNHLEK